MNITAVVSKEQIESTQKYPSYMRNPILKSIEHAVEYKRDVFFSTYKGKEVIVVFKERQYRDGKIVFDDADKYYIYEIDQPVKEWIKLYEQQKSVEPITVILHQDTARIDK